MNQDVAERQRKQEAEGSFMSKDDKPQGGARRMRFAAMIAGAMLLSVPSGLSAAPAGPGQHHRT
jgi:hypothetical protein